MPQVLGIICFLVTVNVKSMLFTVHALVSFVTYIEFLGYKSVSKATQEFMALAGVIEIDKDIIDTCITLRKSKAIKLPDAIIASTALSRGLSLITRNVEDFKKIKDLKVVNLYNL